MTRAQDISLIVPVYNGGRGWLRSLGTLLALEPPPGEIIIVDDGSTDDSGRAALACHLVVVTTARPRSGPACARNLGAAQAHGEILFFVDADVLVRSDAVARVACAFADSSVSAIFGSYDDAPDDPTFLAQYKNLLHHSVHQSAREEATSFWAGCGAIRRQVFCGLGGFRQTYRRPSIEDIELGYRLRQAGGRIRLVKDLQVKHLKHWTWRSLLLTDVRDRALPWARLIMRQRQLAADLNLQVPHRVSALLCWLLLALLPGVMLSKFFWVPVLLTGSVVLWLNLDLYWFLYRKRGMWFTLRAIPLHWFYYLYSSAAFASVLLVGAWNNVTGRAGESTKSVGDQCHFE